MKKLLIAVLCVFAAACTKDPQTSNRIGEYNVEKLFEHDGCTVYRFFDARYVYYTSCKGNTDYTCGKGCEDNVKTTVLD